MTATLQDILEGILITPLLLENHLRNPQNIFLIGMPVLEVDLNKTTRVFDLKT